MSQFEEQPEYLTQPAFFRIPKALFTDESYSELTVSAKMLYGLLLDRLNISRMNRLTDREGRAFVYFTLDEVMSRLHCARAKADGLMDELRATGLIETKRRGQGKGAAFRRNGGSLQRVAAPMLAADFPYFSVKGRKKTVAANPHRL